MKKRCLLGLIFLGLFISSFALAEDFCEKPVMTESGLVQGESEKEAEVCVWRGIPYAQPPVGELRWRAPQPHQPWQGVRKTTKWAPKCMQKGIMKLLNADPSGKMSEDCLYLNIWRPKKPGKYPVMVWIHGGGYVGGTGNTPNYWGDRLAEQGIVVVSFNYRLNVFGFFAHPKLREEDPNQSTGGYGTLDQIFLLRWVQNNIANFGGDPNNVTIFGESAGGWSICTLLATPLAKGLFHRAILESGGCVASTDLETGYQQAKEIAQKVGCDFEDLDCLRKVPAKKLLRKSLQGPFAMEFFPRHDNYILTATPIEMIRAGNYNRVPFIAGSNKNEFGMLVGLAPQLYFASPKKYKKKMISLVGAREEEAEELVRLYPLDEFENKPRKAYGAMVNDITICCPTYLGLEAVAEKQTGVYYYRFDYGPGLHSTEIPFVFNTLDRPPASRLLPRKLRREGKELAELVQAYWVNFARTGNPNAPSLPNWPEFRPDQQLILVLDKPPRAESAEMEERCEAWEKLSQRISYVDFLSQMMELIP